MDDQTKLSFAERLVQGVGIVDIPLAEVRKCLGDHCQKFRQAWHFHIQTSQCDEALNFLSTLTFPITKHVIFPTCSGGAAMVNNHRDGSDYAGYGRILPNHFQCRFSRVVCRRGRIWKNKSFGLIHMNYEARIFELYDFDRQPIRTVACADDGGRWIFHTSGNPHPIEADFPYGAKRTRDRFSEKNLHDLATAYGLPIPTTADLINADSYLLYLEDPSQPIISCTLEEADDPAYGYYLRGMGFAKHMSTHFERVIIDLEKCVAIDPSYEPRVREIIDQARRMQKKRGHLRGNQT